mgnify:CR=1 FL=1
MKNTKYKKELPTLDLEKVLSVDEAVEMVTSQPKRKFVESVDVAVSLGIDPKKSDQNVRGSLTLPHSLGKDVKVVAFVDGEKATEAKSAGADFIGTDELLEKYKDGNIDFDVAVTTPAMMKVVSKLAKVLGPKGLMPNPKLGTVTNEISQSVKDAKSGQVKFKNDKSGIVHAGVGKLDLSEEDLLENIKTLYSSVSKSKPSAVKGSFIKKVTIASTMGVGLNINQASLR